MPKRMTTRPRVLGRGRPAGSGTSSTAPGKDPQGTRSTLTPRQHEAIMLAYGRGYYELPRRLNLRQLAGQMAMSAAALSELLRRAEAHLVRDYANGAVAHDLPA